MTNKKEREQLMSDEDRIAAWKRKGRRCIYCCGQRPVDAITDRLFGCCSQCAAWDNNAQVVKEMLPCLCCGKQLQAGTAFGEHEDITVNTVDHQGFGDGMATRISCGFGSKLDGNVYMIALCDDCTKQKESEGLLTYVYNYIPNGSPTSC